MLDVVDFLTVRLEDGIVLNSSNWQLSGGQETADRRGPTIFEFDSSPSFLLANVYGVYKTHDHRRTTSRPTKKNTSPKRRKKDLVPLSKMSINRSMSEDTKRLFDAIENGNEEMVEKLIQRPSTDISWKYVEEVSCSIHRSKVYNITLNLIAVYVVCDEPHAICNSSQSSTNCSKGFSGRV